MASRKILRPTDMDWETARSDLDAYGHADLGPVLSKAAAQKLMRLYLCNDTFRSHIIMRRHGFGEGEYKYFANPLPDVIAELRTGLYPGLATIANGWRSALGLDPVFPAAHADYLAICHAAGQSKPTPLMLKYGPGDYNCLHQDIYGDHLFPIQVVILLSETDAFEGGEFVLTEQRPRMQSRAEVVRLATGHAAAFAVNERPRMGAKGAYRVKQRHGVSRIRAGERMTLGIIFHDAA